MKLNKYIDHTLLKQDAAKNQIDCLLSEARSMILPVFALIDLGEHSTKGLEGTDVQVCHSNEFSPWEQLNVKACWTRRISKMVQMNLIWWSMLGLSNQVI